jgi:hypothetical protein
MLALAFIIVVSVIVLALTSWATDDLNNTTKFSSVASLHSTVTSATDVAIQSIRFNPIPSTTPSSAPTSIAECWGPPGSISQVAINSLTVTLWCSTQETLTRSPGTRIVTVEACVGAGATSPPPSCSPVLTAVVDFNDYPSGGLLTLTQQCNYYANPPCGDGMSIASWTWN